MQLQDRAVLDLTIDLEDFFQTKIPKIIDNVKGDEPANWGLMNVHQMLEHLLFPLNFAITEAPIILVTPEEKLPRQREFLESEYGMPKNFKTPFLPVDKTVPLIKTNLEESKQLLKDTILQFLSIINTAEFKTKLHPVFGQLDKQQWLTFQYKHFSHHFMQFGLL
jgi:oxepin-CoA hydrolase/3-oxo-5,6-dehydrosuberyl-CoA semialdehyde dehydrogenase